MSILNQYSDDEFIRIVEKSNSYKNCLQQLGYNSFSGSTLAKLKERIQKLNISIDHFTSNIKPTKRSVENIFIENSTAAQKTLREWYRKGNYSEYKCSICGQLPFWNNKELTLILDHINGKNTDDRLENLRWVCPNCNYQLDTTNGKNKQHKEHTLNYCIDCGKVITKNAKRCISCNNKRRSNKQSGGIV